MTPQQTIDWELRVLRDCAYGLTSDHLTSFIFGWYSENIIWVRIFYRAQLAEWFSFKIETEDDISAFRTKMSEALRRAKR